jgi:hypothetical protein
LGGKAEWEGNAKCGCGFSDIALWSWQLVYQQSKMAATGPWAMTWPSMDLASHRRRASASSDVAESSRPQSLHRVHEARANMRRLRGCVGVWRVWPRKSRRRSWLLTLGRVAAGWSAGLELYDASDVTASVACFVCSCVRKTASMRGALSRSISL